MQSRTFAQGNCSMLFGMSESAVGKTVKSGRYSGRGLIPKHPSVNVSERKSLIVGVSFINIQLPLRILPRASSAAVKRSEFQPAEVGITQPRSRVAKIRFVNMPCLYFGKPHFVTDKIPYGWNLARVGLRKRNLLDSRSQ